MVSSGAGRAQPVPALPEQSRLRLLSPPCGRGGGGAGGGRRGESKRYIFLGGGGEGGGGAAGGAPGRAARAPPVRPCP